MKTTKKFITKKTFEEWMGSDATLQDYIALIIELANGNYSPEELRRMYMIMLITMGKNHEIQSYYSRH